MINVEEGNQLNTISYYISSDSRFNEYIPSSPWIGFGFFSCFEENKFFVARLFYNLALDHFDLTLRWLVSIM